MDGFANPLKAIAFFVLVFLFVLALPVLLMLPVWMLAGLVAIALLLAVPVFFLWRWRARRSPWGEWPSYARLSLLAVLLTGTMLGFPVYYLAFQVDARPMVVPAVTLSNGDKTIVFQGMMHVGAESFYKSVVYDLEDALSQGYRLYYEGVQSGTKESDKWFSDNLAGGGDLSGNYRTMATACGMKFQTDYFSPLARDFSVHPERHVMADVTTLQMQQEYERLMKTDPGFDREVKEKARKDKEQAVQMNEFLTGVVEWQKKSTKDQQYLAGVICRGFFNVLLSATPQPGVLDPVVLDLRNRELVKRLLADDSKKIYVTYGSHHLEGVLPMLKQKDARWQVKSVKWIRAMAAPEHFERAL